MFLLILYFDFFCFVSGFIWFVMGFMFMCVTTIMIRFICEIDYLNVIVLFCQDIKDCRSFASKQTMSMLLCNASKTRRHC